MPNLSKSIKSPDEIRLTEGKYLLETSKGEVIYQQTNVKYWERRERAVAVAEYWTREHACYVHMYKMVNGFTRWVGSWVAGGMVKNQMGF